MKALDEAEERIGCKLPAGFRAAYATKKVLTSIAHWQMFEPSKFYRTRGGEYRIASERTLDVPIDAVVVGRSDEAPLFLRVRGGASSEALFTWEDQATEPTHVARSLAELVDGAPDAADDLLERAGFAVEEKIVDITCPFCATTDSITVDPSGGAAQTFVEDCANCCHPRVVHVEPTNGDDGDDGVHVWVERG